MNLKMPRGVAAGEEDREPCADRGEEGANREEEEDDVV
jgi:hypothetical protein